MNWFQNFSLVMRSTVTTLCEKVENPERMIQQLLIDMEEEFERVRESVAEAIADEILLGKRLEQARRETEKWERRAAEAMGRSDERTAEAALEQKLLAEERAENLAEEHQKQKKQTEKLKASVRELENRIRQARQKRTLLLARLTRADSEQRISHALGRAENRSALAQFRRLEDRVERAEAMTDAYDRLDDRDPEAEELEERLEEAERKERLAAELADLRDRLQEDG